MFLQYEYFLKVISVEKVTRGKICENKGGGK